MANMYSAAVIDHKRYDRVCCPMMSLLKRTTVWIEKVTLQKLEKMAKREDRTVGYVIRRILADGVKQER
jgi:hypothetical protein